MLLSGLLFWSVKNKIIKKYLHKKKLVELLYIMVTPSYVHIYIYIHVC